MVGSSQIPSNAPVARVLWRDGTVLLDDGTRLRTFEAGRRDASAPVIMLIHGLGHSTQSAWDRVVPAFLATHRIVAFDLPGFGASEAPRGPYSHAFFVAAVEAVSVARDVRVCAIAGHSLGGLVAAEYAAAHPERVRALALLSPAGFLRTPSLIARIAGSSLARHVPLRCRASRAFVLRAIRKATYDPAAFDALEIAQLSESARDPATARAFLGVYAGAREHLFRLRATHARFARYAGPVTLVWGREDRYIPIRALANARRVYPNADVLIVERCGHCPHVEHAAAVTARLLASGFAAPHQSPIRTSSTSPSNAMIPGASTAATIGTPQ